MKKMKKVTAVLLAAVCTIGLCACGKTGNKYEELESLLDRGAYDDAIMLIEDMSYAEAVEKGEKGSVSGEGQYVPGSEELEILSLLAGTYEYYYYYDLDEYQPVVIGEDGIIEYNGEKYCTIVQKEDEKSGTLKLYTEQDYMNFSDSVYPQQYVYYSISDNGIITVDYSYRSQSVLKELAKDFYKDYVGTYRYEGNSWYEIDEVTINEDYTAVIDGTTVELFVYSSEYDEGVTYSFIACDGDYAENPLDLRLKENAYGMNTVLDGYVRDDQLEYVEITVDNIDDYFEWTDWTVGSNYINYNAFDEVESITAHRYYQLKEEYMKKLYEDNCSVAFEYQSQYVSYPYCTAVYDMDSDVFSLTINTENVYERSEPETSEVSRLNWSGYYDENDKYVVTNIWLFRDDAYINMDHEGASQDGSVITDPSVGYNDYYHTNPVTILRTKTTLSFVNK